MTAHKANLKILFFPVVCLISMGFLIHYLASLKYGVPLPTIHDEFSYLLSADTFAHGRITNPTHPLWRYFQTFHVFFRPTYQSKFPPFQGLFLAIGQRFFGAPIWGVWLSLGLAYGATYWMFLAKLRPRYALMGTLLVVVINPYISLNWGHTYWGGGVAMLGGALFFGGLLHSRNELSLTRTLWMGMGLVILSNSRPFEGLVVFLLSLPLMVIIGVRNVPNNGGVKTMKTLVVPMFVMGALAIGWILYYDHELTGNAFKFYYLNWKAASATVDSIKHYMGSPPLTYMDKLTRLWNFFMGPFLSLSLIGIIFMLLRRELIFEFSVVLGLTAVSIYYSQAWPHYMAPVASLIYLIIFCGFYEIKRLKLFKNEKMPQTLFMVVMAVYFVLSASGTYALFEKGPARPYIGKLRVRADIIRKLEHEQGKDLVIVSYGPKHNSHEEWVYNRAGIDNAQIVWARDLGQEKNQHLLEYYKDRTVWLLYPDRKPIGLIKLNHAASKS